MNARVVIIALLATAVGVYADHNCGLEAGYCQNGGMCHDSSVLDGTRPGSAGNGWSTPSCLCKAPYAGPACEYSVRECKDSPCKNGGTCVPADCQAVTSPYARFDCFKCLCAPGWTGSPRYTASGPNPGGLCDWPLPVGDCSVNQCLNGGTCTSINSATVSTFSCACAPGFKPSGTGNNCSIAFDCSTNAPACQNGGTCVSAGATCSCGFYSGDQCQNARWCDSNPCQNGGSCTNLVTNPIGGPTSRGSCSCTTDFAGTFCERPSFCSTNPCQNGGTCDTVSSTCTCTQGWEGANCTVPLFCSSNPCQNGANCTNTASVAGGAGTCGPCPEGYAGTFCEKKIPGCGTPLVGCKVEHTTEFGTGNPSCKCVDRTTCTNSNWNTKCSCQSGPTSSRPNDGFHYDCRCNSTYVPKCPQQQLGGGATPGVFVDMVCENGGTCVELAEVSGCQCRAGFWGDRCQFYDNPCRVSPCKNGGMCFIVGETQGLALDDRFWGRRCACRWPYYGETCEEVAPGPVVCTNNQCMNGATCGPRTYSTNGGFFANFDGADVAAPPYQCFCAAGYWGLYCERQVEVCTATSCQNGGTCFQSGNRISCACTCGYAGTNCEVVASNFNPAAALTFSAGGGVGYRLEFCSNNPCQNGGSCYNAVNGQTFQCACKSGYYGTYCQYRGRSAAAGVAPSWIAVAAATVLVALQLIKF